MKKLLLILALLPTFVFGQHQHRLTNAKYFESAHVDTAIALDSIGILGKTPPAGEVWIYSKGVGQTRARYSDSTDHNLDSAGSSIAFINVYGDASDGDSTWSGSAKTLTRDMFFRYLNVAALCTVKTAGYRIFCKDSATVNGLVILNGNNGTNGTDASGATAGGAGTSGSVITTNYFAIGGASGTAGGGATTGNGTTGGNSGNTTNGIGSIGAAGVAGGGGGAGNNGAAGSGGGAGSNSLFSNALASSGGVRNWFNATQGRLFSSSAVIAFTVNGSPAGSGGGGAGGTGLTGTRGAGGGAGGAGSNAGTVCLNVYKLRGSGRIEAVGGSGGKGGNGGNATGGYGSGGGGSGGNGGSGGLIVFTFSDTSGWTGIFTAAGGTPGAKGTGGVGGNASGSDGNPGNTGTAGIIIRFRI